MGILFVFYGLPNLNKSFIKNALYYDLPILLWIFWVIVNSIFFNPILNPKMDIYIFFVRIILPFIIYFGIRLNLTNVNIEKQWLWLYIALLFHSILIFVFEEPNTVTTRLGNYMNSNDIAWIALLALITSFVVVKKKYLIYLTVVLSFILILLTASKKGMLSFFFFFGLKFLVFSRMSLIKRFSVIVIFFIMLSFGIPLIVKYTYIGDRFQKTIEQNKQAEEDSELFDGRANFFIVGWDLFKEKPITGYGITNFYYFGEMGLVAHSEYVVQIVELGLIGFIIFLIFHIRLLAALIKLYKTKVSNQIVSILLVSILVFYGLFLGKWVYDNIAYNIFLALMINTIIIYNKKLEYNNEYLYEGLFYR